MTSDGELCGNKEKKTDLQFPRHIQQRTRIHLVNTSTRNFLIIRYTEFFLQDMVNDRSIQPPKFHMCTFSTASRITKKHVLICTHRIKGQFHVGFILCF